MRTKTRVGILAAALVSVCGILLAPAQAAPPSLERDLIDACDVKTDRCVFHPKGEMKKVAGESHQVGESHFNCGISDSTLDVSWSDTDTSSYTYGSGSNVDLGPFADVFKVGFQASYSKTVSDSHQESQATRLTVPAGEMGWVTREAVMLQAEGEYEMDFPNRFWDHYKWYLSGTGTVPSGEPGSVTTHSRTMTPEEAKSHCG